VATATATATKTDAALTRQASGLAGEHCAQCSPCCVHDERGFALLEVLVAFVIAALALGVLFNAGLSGLQSARAASHYEQAVARARSHLALAVHASPLVAGDWQGDDGGGFAWHLRVTPMASTTVAPVYAVTARRSATFPLTLYAVSVVIAWRDGDRAREVRFDTEQIGQGMR
jgi:general secretion pathway protein I